MARAHTWLAHRRRRPADPSRAADAVGRDRPLRPGRGRGWRLPRPGRPAEREVVHRSRAQHDVRRAHPRAGGATGRAQHHRRGTTAAVGVGVPRRPAYIVAAPGRLRRVRCRAGRPRRRGGVGRRNLRRAPRCALVGLFLLVTGGLLAWAAAWLLHHGWRSATITVNDVTVRSPFGRRRVPLAKVFAFSHHTAHGGARSCTALCWSDEAGRRSSRLALPGRDPDYRLPALDAYVKGLRPPTTPPWPVRG